MAWAWRFETVDGSEVAPAVRPEEFTTQGDAESWLGENWRGLAEGGADQARLFEDGTEVYGPMSLHPDSANGADAVNTADAADGARAAGSAEAAEGDGRG